MGGKPGMMGGKPGMGGSMGGGMCGQGMCCGSVLKSGVWGKSYVCNKSSAITLEGYRFRCVEGAQTLAASAIGLLSAAYMMS